MPALEGPQDWWNTVQNTQETDPPLQPILKREMRGSEYEPQRFLGKSSLSNLPPRAEQAWPLKEEAKRFPCRLLPRAIKH